MEGTHQQVDVTPCSNRQEETDTFMVLSLLHSIVTGSLALSARTRHSDDRVLSIRREFESEPLSGVLPYTNTEQVNYE